VVGGEIRELSSVQEFGDVASGVCSPRFQHGQLATSSLACMQVFQIACVIGSSSLTLGLLGGFLCLLSFILFQLLAGGEFFCECFGLLEQ
jgi:hypothetical protein